jgi:(2R)-ethylmalonyl-CoA mutase
VDAPVVVGGIIPAADQVLLKSAGVARVYTPKDYRLAVIMADLAELALEHRRNRTKHSTPAHSQPMD